MAEDYKVGGGEVLVDDKDNDGWVATHGRPKGCLIKMDWQRREVGTTFLSVIVNCKVLKERKHQAALMETRLQSQKEDRDGQHLMMLCSSARG